MTLKERALGGLKGVSLESVLEKAVERKLHGVCIVVNETVSGDDGLEYQTKRTWVYAEEQPPRYRGLAVPEPSFKDLPRLLDGHNWLVWWDSSLTGHMYFGASHETDDSCGNCDGANCCDDDDHCKRIYNLELRLLREVECACMWVDEGGVLKELMRPCPKCWGRGVVEEVA